MVTGNQGFTRADRISARNSAMEKEGKCTFCRPNRGENWQKRDRRVSKSHK